MWTIKAIMRAFELSSSLGLNFHKSSLIGVNVEPTFLDLAENFLHCKSGFLPFKYLGLLVGDNP